MVAAEDFHLGQIVWAKVYSYPHWPAAIVPEFGKSHFNAEKELVHLKFFGENQRSWVSTSDIIVFDGSEEQADEIMSKVAKSYHKSLKKNHKLALTFFDLPNSECIVKLRNSSKFVDQLFEARATQIVELQTVESSVSESESSRQSSVSPAKKLKRPSNVAKRAKVEPKQVQSRIASNLTSETSNRHFGMKFNSIVIADQKMATGSKKAPRQSNSSLKEPSMIQNDSSDEILSEESINEVPDANQNHQHSETEMKEEEASLADLSNNHSSFNKSTVFDQQYTSFLESHSKADKLSNLTHGFCLRKRASKSSLSNTEDESEVPKKRKKIHSKTEAKKVKGRPVSDKNTDNSNQDQELASNNSSNETDSDQAGPKTNYPSQDFKINAIGFKPMIKCMVSNYQINADEKICSECLKLVELEAEENVYKCTKCVKTWHPECYKAIYNKKASETNESSKFENGVGVEFICFACAENKHQCFVCHNFDDNLITCKIPGCNNSFHAHCIEPYNNVQNSNSAQGKSTCPHHFCLPCFHQNPENIKRPSAGQLLKCAYCPFACHTSDFCMPAGSVHLGADWIKCPRHANLESKDATISYSDFCYACGDSERLMRCSSCPFSFHPHCIGINVKETDLKTYKCHDCNMGKFIHFGQIVWVKYKNYSWWPGQVVHQRYASEAIRKSKHQDGQFIIHFFGSNDFIWTYATKAYLYADGDDTDYTSKEGKKLQQAVLDADIAYQIYKLVMEKHKTKYMETFHYIKSNVPVAPVTAKKFSASDIQVCECGPEPGACSDENCINISMEYECNPKNCHAKEFCQNQRFVKRQYPKFQVVETKSRGWGLFADEVIKKDQFVNEYVGQLIDKAEFNRRVKSDQENNILNLYYLHLDSDRIIDARLKSNNARFINHSCDPNLIANKWLVNGDFRIGFFALKDIKPGTELTFNYNLALMSNHNFICHCGSANCQKSIGKKQQKSSRKSAGTQDSQ